MTETSGNSNNNVHVDKYIPLSIPFAWERFADSWNDGLLAQNLGQSLTCSEVNALADMFLAHDMREAADLWLEAHAVGDDCGDQHCTCDNAECIAERNGDSAFPMEPKVAEVTPAEVARVEDHLARLAERYSEEFARLDSMGIANVEIVSTGGNCLAITGAAGVTPDGDDSMYILATTNQEPQLDRPEDIEVWTVGLYVYEGVVQERDVALAYGEARLNAVDTSADAIERAMTRAYTALRSGRVNAAYGEPMPHPDAVPTVGDRGFYWLRDA